MGLGRCSLYTVALLSYLKSTTCYELNLLLGRGLRSRQTDAASDQSSSQTSDETSRTSPISTIFDTSSSSSSSSSTLKEQDHRTLFSVDFDEDEELRRVKEEEEIFWGRFLDQDITSLVESTPSPTRAPAVVPTGTILALVEDRGELSTLSTAIGTGDLGELLVAQGPFTLFAPINAAFDSLDQEYLQLLLQPGWILHLQNLLLYHAVSVEAFSSSLTNGQVLDMANEEKTTVDLPGGGGVVLSGEFFETSSVVTADLDATNGVIHTVSQVFLPEFIATNLNAKIQGSEYEVMALLIAAAGIQDDLISGTYTILAPNDAAFEKVDLAVLQFLSDEANVDALRDVLLYHALLDVLPSSIIEDAKAYETAQGDTVLATRMGSNIAFNNAMVETANILASNGIIHAIDTVLFPPDFTISDTAAPTDKPTPQPIPQPTNAPITLSSVSDTIFSIIEADDELGTLESAMLTADFAGLLGQPGPYTVFAPIDAGLAKLDQQYLAQLLEPAWILHLQYFLFYHVLLDVSLNSADFTNGLALETVIFEDVVVGIADDDTISFSGEYFGPSAMKQADLFASNGVVHKVNDAFIPMFFANDLFDIVSANTNLGTLRSLIVKAALEAPIRAGNLTLIAPIDDAFAALDPQDLDYLNDDANVEALQMVLLYHAIDDILITLLLTDGERFTTLNSNRLTITLEGSNVFFGTAAVVNGDQLAKNGIMHNVDEVLIPPDVILPSGSGGAGFMGSVVPSSLPSDMQSSVLESEGSDYPSLAPSLENGAEEEVV